MQLGILIRAIAYVPCNSIAVRRHCKKKKDKITTKRKLLRSAFSNVYVNLSMQYFLFHTRMK